MASGRMISRSLGRSKKFNALPDHFTKLVYVLALTHADAEGRIEVDPHLMYADSFVFDSEATPERVRTSLTAIADAGLITLYEAGDKVCGEFADFHKHNTITRHKNGPKEGKPLKEAESKLPSPTGKCPSWATGPEGTPEQGSSNSGPTPERVPTSAAQDKVREDKVREVLEPPKGSRTNPVTTTENEAPAVGRVAPDGGTPPDEITNWLQGRLDTITAMNRSEPLKDGLRREARAIAAKRRAQGSKPTLQEHLDACRAARAEGREPPTPPGLLA